ncbi:MAG: ankyrin repeat domain-containing protein, partial [Proteobacteria bacterium]
MLTVPQETANQALLNATLYADLELFEMALECGADLQSQHLGVNELGLTALQRILGASSDKADISNHIAITKRLLSYPIDLNKQLHPSPSSYPLFMALTSGHSELVHLLIENGAIIWSQGAAGAEMVSWAARSGMNWFVSRVLQRLSPPYPNPDEKMKRGLELALCQAARKGHLEIVEMLIDFGVNVDAGDEYGGGTPIMLAAQEGHLDIAQLLRERNADLLSVGPRGETLLLGAFRGGLLPLANELLSKGADPQASNFYNITALHSVGETHREEMVESLITAGASLLARDKGDHTVLHSAAGKGDLELAKACLEAGEKADVTDNWGYTPFMNAASHGNIAMMELLVQHGANPEHIAHYEGETALHYAVFGHQKDTIAWLLNRKVKLTNVLESTNIGEVTP